jgi:hypothetical protein
MKPTRYCLKRGGEIREIREHKRRGKTFSKYTAHIYEIITLIFPLCYHVLIKK